MFSPFLRPFSGWKSVSGKSWYSLDYDDVFQISKSRIFRPVEAFKNWSALKSENAPRDDDEKAFLPFHLPLACATCVGEGSYWTAVWAGLNVV